MRPIRYAKEHKLLDKLERLIDCDVASAPVRHRVSRIIVNIRTELNLDEFFHLEDIKDD